MALSHFQVWISSSGEERTKVAKSQKKDELSRIKAGRTKIVRVSVLILKLLILRFMGHRFVGRVRKESNSCF